MLERLVARLKGRHRPPSDRELAEDEALRRQAEEELRRAEARMAEQRGDIKRRGGSADGGFVGW